MALLSFLCRWIQYRQIRARTRIYNRFEYKPLRIQPKHYISQAVPRPWGTDHGPTSSPSSSPAQPTKHRLRYSEDLEIRTASQGDTEGDVCLRPPACVLARGVGQGSFRGRIAHQPLPAKVRLSTELVAPATNRSPAWLCGAPHGQNHRSGHHTNNTRQKERLTRTRLPS